MHVDMSATRRRARRRFSVNFVKFFGEQLFLAERGAHDKMAVLPGPIRRGLARLVRTIGTWDRGKGSWGVTRNTVVIETQSKFSNDNMTKFAQALLAFCCPSCDYSFAGP